MYIEDNPVVAEALRRLPAQEQELRLFRLRRALDLSMKKSVLPRHEWTTPDEVRMEAVRRLLEKMSLYTCTCFK